MKLSAPIHVLKSKAKKIKKEKKLTMTEALNSTAREEGYDSWSLLMAKAPKSLPSTYGDLLGYMNPGDLALVGARPGMCKTSFTIGLFVKAIQERRKKSFYFSLAETHMDVAGRIGLYDQSIGQDDSLFELDYSNEISADYIVKKATGAVGSGALIVVDYLQLLDEKREHPPLQNQVETLKAFAKESGCIIIFISQLRRELEYESDKRPTEKDIRLPNPLDLKLFNKIMLLYRKGEGDTAYEVLFRGKTNHTIFIERDRDSVKFLG